MDLNTELPPQIYRQISRVMGDIGAVTKDSKNEQQKYMFRGIEAFYAAAHPALIKHGVFCVPEVIERQEYRFDKESYFDGKSKTTTWLHVTVKVRHRFYAEDGSFVDVITVGEGLDNSDKASNKAMSGAMKYAFIELFSIPTRDVEDSDRGTPEQGKKTMQVTAKDIPVKQTPIQPVGGLMGSSQLSSPLLSPSLTKSVAKNWQAIVDKDAKLQQVAPSPPVENNLDTQSTQMSEVLEKSIQKVAAMKTMAAKPKAKNDPEFVKYPGCVNYGQEMNFINAWHEACIDSGLNKSQVELLRHDWLKNNGFITPDGKPTSAMIPASVFFETKRQAVKFAQGLKTTAAESEVDEDSIPL